MLKIILAVIGRDLKLAMRRQADIVSALFFFIIVVSLFPLGAGRLLVKAQDWAALNVGWYYLLAMTLYLVFVVAVIARNVRQLVRLARASGRTDPDTTPSFPTSP